MRYFVIAAAMIGVMGTANVAEAQLPFRFGIAGGVSAPAGDISDVTNAGFNATLLTEFKAPVLPFAVRIEGAWNQFGFDKDVTGPVDGNARALSLNANGVLNIPAATLLKFYAIGGAGVYRLRTAVDAGGGTFSSESSNKFGLNIGAGLRLPLPVIEAFLEARYHHVVDTNGFSFVPVTFGIKF